MFLSSEDLFHYYITSAVKILAVRERLFLPNNQGSFSDKIAGSPNGIIVLSSRRIRQ